jgi:hypothetical protein
MEKIIVVLCVLALSVTAYDGYTEMTGEDPFGFKSDSDDEGEDEIEWSDIETVTVPENKMQELLHYDHLLNVEVSWLNKTSGNYSLWLLDYSGQWLEMISGETNKPDGYGETHKTLHLRREMNGQFTFYVDSSDGEELSTDGKMDLQRDEYFDLTYDPFERMILTESNANLSVEELQSTTVPLDFRAFMRSYFDPHEDREGTLEEDIFEDGQTITLGDEDVYKDRFDQSYYWKAERGIKIAGYDTVLINVSADSGDEGDSWTFKEEIRQQTYISNEVPNFVQSYISSNTSFESDDELFYLTLWNSWVLRDDPGYTPGTSDMSFGQDLCTADHWHSQHVEAELETWDGNYMPKAGTDFEESSFDFKTEDMMDFREVSEPSDGLVEFLSDYPNAMITGASYNASKDSNDPRAGDYWWNITYGDKTTGGWGSQEEKRYRLLVYQETTFEWVGNPVHKEYTNEFRVEKDFGALRGGAPYDPAKVADRTLTMASSEKIFKTDNKVIDNFYTTPAGIETEELDWGDGDETVYQLGTSGEEEAEENYRDLVYTLTGIQTLVWEKYYWYIEKEDLLEGGAYASATIDAEDGRLVTIIEIEGTALQNALDFD